MPARPVVRFDPVRTLAFGAIGAAYAPLGGIIIHQSRILRFVNTTDGLLSISFDGVTQNIMLPPNSFVVYDLVTNRDAVLSNLVIEQGTQIYVRFESAPTLGAVYCESMYARGE